VLQAEAVVADKVPPKPGLFLAPESVGSDPVVADEIPQPTADRRRPTGLAFPANRRETYATLVRLRKLVRGLEHIRPFFADPGEQLLTPLRVFEYVQAVREFRGEVHRGKDPRWPGWYGRMVLTVTEHPVSIAVFRDLVPSQRRALAADWARAVDELRAEYDELRAHLRNTKTTNRLSVEFRAAQTWFRDNPEWLLATVIGLAFLAAIIRTALRLSY
jgi:hypothetical protein